MQRPCTASDTKSPAPSWRDWVKVHPAADNYPMMSEDDQRALGEDIEAHGLQKPLVFYCDRVKRNRKDYPSDDELVLLDGRNRIAAMAMVGVPLFDTDSGRFSPDVRCDSNIYGDPIEIIWRSPESFEQFDPYAYIESANLHRRHLTIEFRENHAADLLKARPERSNREVAKIVKLSHPKIAKIRQGLEEAGMVETVTTIVGADGIEQPAHKAAPKPKPSIDTKLPATLFAPPDPEPPAAPAESLAETSELTDGGWIEPHIEAAVREYRKLPPRHRRNAMHVMDVIDLKDHRKIRKDAIRLWAIEHEKVGWLLDHFGIEVKWPNFDAWVGGCGDNNTRVRVDGDPVITAAAARRDKRVRIALAYIASLDLGLDDLTASPGADVEVEGSAS